MALSEMAVFRASELLGEDNPKKNVNDEREGVSSTPQSDHKSGAQSSPTKDIKKMTHHQRRAKVNAARFILGKIAKNEAEGKTDPRDAEDKAKFLAEVAEYEEYKAENPEAFQPAQTKRNRSQGVSDSAPKRTKDPQGKPRATSFVSKKKRFSEVARDSLAMALVDENHDDGRLPEKWEEIEAKLADMEQHMTIKSTI